MAVDKVLVVDNEEFVLQALERLFYGEDFEIFTASSAEAAIQILKDEEIAVVLSDNEMSGQSGIELLAWARKHCPGTVRIMLTGYASLESVLQAVNEAEVYRFFIKPCDFRELKKVVFQALELSRSIRRREDLEKTQEQRVAFLDYLHRHCAEFEQMRATFEREWPQRAGDLMPYSWQT